MKVKEEANEAMLKLNNHTFNGSNITVQVHLLNIAFSKNHVLIFFFVDVDFYCQENKEEAKPTTAEQ